MVQRADDRVSGHVPLLRHPGDLIRAVIVDRVLLEDVVSALPAVADPLPRLVAVAVETTLHVRTIAVSAIMIGVIAIALEALMTGIVR